MDNSFRLQSSKDAFQHTVFPPSVHANIDCMPVSVEFRQCSPLAAVLRNIQYSIDHLEIVYFDIPYLDRTDFFDFLLLLKRDFNSFIIPQLERFNSLLRNSVNSSQNNVHL